METVPELLDVEDVLEIHRLQLQRFGGGDGVRDRGLLESAVAQPQKKDAIAAELERIARSR